jgi:DNA-binding NarL/FixJ family response regulator
VWRTVTICADVLFGAAFGMFTEGATSPACVFFAFAVVAAGVRAGLRQARVVTGASVVMYAVKRFAVETLMEAIRAVAHGNVWMPAMLQNELAKRLRNPVIGELSAREEQIVRYVALGLRNAEVANKLSISEQTVKTHLNAIFRKLQVRDRVELTLFAVRNGLISIRESSK